MRPPTPTGGLAGGAMASPARVMAASLTSMVVAIAPLHLTGALAPELQDELGFDDARLGIVFGGFFGLSALLTPWGGGFTDRVGARRSLRGAAVIGTSASLAIAIAVQSYAALAAALALGAVANAIAQPGNNVLVAMGIPPRHRGLALGIKQAAIPTSTGLAGLALPLVATTVGWRWAFALAAVIGIVAVIAMPSVPRSRPERTKHHPKFRPAPDLLALAVGAAAGAAAVASIGGFLVRSAEEAGFSSGSAGALQVAGSMLLVTARIGWGRLMDRRSLNRFGFSAGLLALGAVGYPLLATGDTIPMIAGALLAFGAGWSWPGVVHLGTVESHPDDPGAASGVVQAGMFTGAFLGPTLFGVVAEHATFGWAWMLSFGWSATAAVLIGASSRRNGGVLVRTDSVGGAGVPEPPR